MKVQAFHVNGLLELLVFVGNRRFLALVDAGATTSLMTREAWKEIGEPPLTPCEVQIQDFDGGSHKCYGEVCLAIGIGSQDYFFDCYVVENAPRKVLIGMDFMERYGIIINVKEKLVTLDDGTTVNGRNINYDGLQANTLSVSRGTAKEGVIRLAKRIKLNPQEAKFVDIVSPLKGISSPLEEQVVYTTGLVPQGTSRVLLCNASTEVQDRQKNDIIGNVSEATCVAEVNMVINSLNNEERFSSAKGASVRKPEAARLQRLLKHTVGYETMNKEEKEVVFNWLQDFADIFALEGEPLGRNGDMPMKIETRDVRPVYRKPYRIPTIYQEEVDRQLKTMVDQGIIERSKSPWSSPLIIVKKKGGGIRLCVDYRYLNEFTKKDKFPLPVINENLNMLHGNTWFSSLDLLSGYWQLSLHPESREKTAFSTKDGHFHFKVVPFGLSNAPPVFQRLMTYIFHKQLNKELLIYLDDIIILGKNLTEHDAAMRRALTTLRNANLRVKLEKCSLLKSSIEYLGHVVTREGLKPQVSKVAAIKNCITPRSFKELRSFLGMCSYYRKFIESFSSRAQPLFKLTSEDAWRWDSTHEEAFADLKEAICEEALLIYPDFGKSFSLTTDASNYAIGGVLSQKTAGIEKPIMFMSRTLQGPELNYSTYETELLAIVYCLKKARPLIYGREVIVKTDHRPLTWLMKTSHTESNGRLARWLVVIQDFNLKIEYLPGKLNNIADFLSRPFQQDVRTISAIYVNANIDRKAIIKHQKKDPDLYNIRQAIDSQEEPESWPFKLDIKFADFKIEDNMLTYNPSGKPLIVLPKKLRHQTIWNSHSDRSRIHPGIDETLRVLQQHYWWPSMHQEVKDVVRECSTCAKQKPKKKTEVPLYPADRGQKPWELIHMDLVGPLPSTNSGNKYVLVVVDSFSKYTELVALPSKDAISVASALNRYVLCKLGSPRSVTSDQGKEFTNEVLQAAMSAWQVKHITTSAYHPASNGQVERINRDLVIKLRILFEETGKQWDQLLEYVQLALNIRTHRATNHSPFYLMYGRAPCVPTKMFTMTPQEERMTYDPANYADEMRHSMGVIYNQVDKSLNQYFKSYDESDFRTIEDSHPKGLVFLDIPKPGKTKLSARYEGPYVVLEQKTPVSYLLEHLTTGHRIVAHKSQIRNELNRSFPSDYTAAPDEITVVRPSSTSVSHRDQLLEDSLGDHPTSSAKRVEPYKSRLRPRKAISYESSEEELY